MQTELFRLLEKAYNLNGLQLQPLFGVSFFLEAKRNEKKKYFGKVKLIKAWSYNFSSVVKGVINRWPQI